LDPDDLFAIFDSAPTSDGAPRQDTAISAQNPKGHAHRKTRSLVGFDPMLDTMEQSKPSNGSQVWTQEELNDVVHPLMSSSSSSSLKRPTRSKPPTHRTSKSVCVSDLHDIASQLSVQRPRAMTSDEERRITLGDSTKDSISKHDQKLLNKRKSHRKSHSVSEIMGLIPKHTPPVTPVTHGKSLVKNKSPTNTPPRSATTTPVQSPKVFRTTKLSPPRPTTTASPITIPSLMKQMPTSFLKDASTMAPRSTEQDPSPHQVAIPSSEDLHVHAKLCALLESYRKMDQNFDFNVLKDVDQLTLKGFVALDSSIAGLTKEQKPIVKSLLDCDDDVRVGGYFTTNEQEERLEVGVFCIQNTILVVYRGTTEQQLKPARQKVAGVELDPENPVMVYPPFRDAYFELETQVYKLLDTLVEENPFSDVVFVGHSFGGALATIGAVRFASARPMLRFACHAFGSPKVGANDFRQMANTLPNLKVMRVEYGSDANTTYPADVGTTKWQHVGHSLVIHASVGTNNGKPPSHPVSAYRFDHKKPNSSMTNLLQNRKPDVQAYIRALEPFATQNLKWVSLYVGEDVGKGVRGKDNEKRLMV